MRICLVSNCRIEILKFFKSPRFNFPPSLFVFLFFKLCNRNTMFSKEIKIPDTKVKFSTWTTTKNYFVYDCELYQGDYIQWAEKNFSRLRLVPET
jgi:hypothetical protein